MATLDNASLIARLIPIDPLSSKTTFLRVLLLFPAIVSVGGGGLSFLVFCLRMSFLRALVMTIIQSSFAGVLGLSLSLTLLVSCVYTQIDKAVDDVKKKVMPLSQLKELTETAIPDRLSKMIHEVRRVLSHQPWYLKPVLRLVLYPLRKLVALVKAQFDILDKLKLAESGLWGITTLCFSVFMLLIFLV
eukprot:GILK01013334.1.p1 GENE.GILK01013334.1~~GILK01013334.1.p1  ORF type:complete len:210 (+),score=10.46 GILK01013334.1:65-631(+)